MLNQSFEASDVRVNFEGLEESADLTDDAVTETSDAFAGLFLEVAANVANQSNSSEGATRRRLSEEDEDGRPVPYARTGEEMEAELQVLHAALNAVNRQVRVLAEDRAVARARAAVLPTDDGADETSLHGRALAERRLSVHSEASVQTGQLWSGIDRLLSSAQRAINLLEKQPRRPSSLRIGVSLPVTPPGDLEEIHGGEDLDEEGSFAAEDDPVG